MSSSTPRETMPSRATKMELRSAPIDFTSLAGKPLYICPRTNTWQSASMCETAMPWNATPTKSIAVSRPGTPVASQASPAITIMWSAGVGFSAFGCTGSSRAHETISPVRTSRAAAARFAGVIRFSAPAWSSAPQRPQFFDFSKISSMRAGVTLIGSSGAGRDGLRHDGPAASRGEGWPTGPSSRSSTSP